MSERVRWDTQPPDLDIRVNGCPFPAAGLENVIANAMIADARSRGKRPPLFSLRYGLARRVTLQLAQIAAQEDNE